MVKSTHTKEKKNLRKKNQIKTKKHFIHGKKWSLAKDTQMQFYAHCTQKSIQFITMIFTKKITSAKYCLLYFFFKFYFVSLFVLSAQNTLHLLALLGGRTSI